MRAVLLMALLAVLAAEVSAQSCTPSLNDYTNCATKGESCLKIGWNWGWFCKSYCNSPAACNGGYTTQGSTCNDCPSNNCYQNNAYCGACLGFTHSGRSCVLKQCAFSGVANGVQLTPTSATINYASAYTIRCNAGYATSASGTSFGGSKSIIRTCQCSAGEAGACNLDNSGAQCLLVTCGFPPAAPTSGTRTTNTQLYAAGSSTSVSYNCNNGYTVNGVGTSFGGITTWTQTCQETGSLAGVSYSQCTIVNCGAPPQVGGFAMSTTSSVTYGSSVTYTCNNGQTTDGRGTALGGQTTFSTTCQATGSFFPTPTPTSCVPVTCGAPPALTNAPSPTSSPIAYSGVVVYTCTTGYSTNGQGTSNGGATSFTSTCGLSGLFTPQFSGCSLISCGLPPAAPANAQVSSIPLYYGDKISYSCVNGYTTSPTGQANAVTTWSRTCQATGVLTAAAYSVCYRVVCTNPPAGTQASPSTNSAPYLTTVTYTCSAGYTVDGTPTGVTSFTRACDPTGAWLVPSTGSGSCLPVSCGVAPGATFTTWSPAATIITYQGVVTYTCKAGYSFDASPQNSANAAYNRVCQADGTLTSDTVQICQRILCGAPPTPYLSGVATSATAKYYLDSTTYQCSTGYSTTGVAGGQVTFTRTCQSDGTFSTPSPAGCQLINCGTYNLPLNANFPSSTTSATYPSALTITCKTGYTTNGLSSGPSSFLVYCQSTGTYTPSPTCSPVSCGVPSSQLNAIASPTTAVTFGGVVTYTCNTGYITTAGSFPTVYAVVCQSTGIFSAPTATCTRISCGVLPSISNADASTNLAVRYGDQFYYTCQNGYTTSGQVSGSVSFTGTCQADGSISVLSSCLPVSCGGAPSVTNAGLVSGVFTYGQMVTYTCLTGYTTSGNPTDPSTFKATCNYNGQYIGMSSCQPINCGTPPAINYATYSNVPLTYNQQVAVSCNTGYSVTGTVTGAKSFQLTCTLTASYSGIQSCLPITCGVPQPTTTAAPLALSSNGGAALYGDSVTYVCNTGYSLTGLVGLQYISFSVTCQSSGTFSTASVCQPIACPSAPVVANAVYNSTARVYQQTVLYQCKPGFTSTGQALGASSFSITCQFDGTYTPVQSCSPVACGVPPVVADSTRPTTQVYYPGSVVYSCTAGHTTNGQLGGPSSFNTSCLSSGSFSPASVCQVTSCGASPAITNATKVCTGTSYLSTCTYNCAFGYSVPTPNVRTCGADGQWNNGNIACDLEKCGPPSNVANADRVCVSDLFLQNEYCDYTCTAGYVASAINTNVTLRLCNDTVWSWPAGKPMVCVNQPCSSVPLVNFATTTQTTPAVYLQNILYSCAAGYTISGELGGPTNFNITCLVDKTYSQPEQCLPISCGIPPTETQSTRNPSAVTYGSTALYTCNTGYTTTGVASAPATWTRACQADGTFAAAAQCIAVSCGFAPAIYAASVVPATSISYPNSVAYTCGTGYTTDGLPNGVKTFASTCQASGIFTSTQSCQRVICGSVPTVSSASANTSSTLLFGDAVLFTCNSGYSLNGLSSGATTFVQTCLATATLTAGSFCLPISCGSPPVIANAVLSSSAALVYSNTAVYTCNTGFTTTGVAGASTTFSRTCQADGTFSAAQSCSPIVCGAPSAVDFATMGYLNGSLVYGQQVSYQCVSGYSTTGFVSDTQFFTRTCLLSGQFSQAATCTPVLCNAPPTLANAQVSGSALRFNQIATYVCSSGYSLTGLFGGISSFNRTCNSSGLYSDTSATCTPIICGPAPVVISASASVSNSAVVTFASSAVQYTCATGYTTTGQVGASTTFAVVCQANATFSPPRTCSPVSCGVPPAVAHAAYSTAAVTFSQAVNYACNFGYTVNGTAIGATSFSAVCQASGTYGNVLQCLPNTCGPLPVISFASTTSTGAISYPSSVSYSCNAFYTLDGNFNGPTSFTVACENNGIYSGIQVCQPISCGIDAAQLFATPNTTAVLTYNQVIGYTCNVGFTVTGFASGATTWSRTCLSTGTFSPASQCLPVNCGYPPAVAHAGANNVSIYYDPLTPPMAAEYGCDDGYIVSGSITNFTRTCQPNGQFTAASACVPRVCTNLPQMPFATVSATNATFPNSAVYTCATGYTVDGSAAGANTIPVPCLSTGLFALQPLYCQPVQCGTAVAVFNAVFFPATPQTYNQNVTFTCVTGFELVNATGTGLARPNSFVETCQASGTFTPAYQCTLISCGTATVLPNGVYTCPQGTLYNNTCTGSCNNGYALTGSQAPIVCQSDYRWSSNGAACTDIDECLIGSDDCSINARCVNIPGGYSCTCRSGFTPSASQGHGANGCNDINECTQPGRGGCQDLCINDIGSYQCGCSNSSLHIALDGRTCVFGNETILSNGTGTAPGRSVYNIQVLSMTPSFGQLNQETNVQFTGVFQASLSPKGEAGWKCSVQWPEYLTSPTNEPEFSTAAMTFNSDGSVTCTIPPMMTSRLLVLGFLIDGLLVGTLGGADTSFVILGPQPQVLSVNFTSDLMRLSVLFSEVISVDSLYQNCASLFDNATLYTVIGPQSSCNVSNRIITITPSGPFPYPFQKISLAIPGVIYNGQETYSLAATGTYIINEPLNGRPPIALNGPSSISSCQDLVLSVSSTANTGGRPTVLKWQVSAFPTSVNTTSLTAFFTTDAAVLLMSGATLAVPQAYMAATTSDGMTVLYNFTVQSINFVLFESYPATLIVQKVASNAVPLVSLQATNVTMTTNQQLTATATVFQCNTSVAASSRLSFAWTVYSTYNANFNYPISSTINQAVFPSLSFPSGDSYTIQVTVTDAATGLSSVPAQMIVTVVGSPLSIRINGQSKQVVQLGFALTAVATDPDYVPGVYVYQWSCVLETSAPCFAGNNAFMSTTGAVLSVPANTLTTLYTYTFSVTATHAGRSTLAPATIDVQAINAVDVLIVNVDLAASSPSIVNTNSRFGLIGSINGSTSNLVVSWTANEVSVDGTVLSSLDLMNPSVVCSLIGYDESFNLCINANIMNPNSMYVFTLTASNLVTSTSSHQTIQTNGPPLPPLSQAPLTVSPATGYAYGYVSPAPTLYSMAMFGWTDSIPEYGAIAYDFGIYGPGAFFMPLVVASTSPSSTTLYLPPSFDGSSNGVVVGRASDSLNVSAMTTVSVVNRPFIPRTPQDTLFNQYVASLNTSWTNQNGNANGNVNKFLSDIYISVVTINYQLGSTCSNSSYELSIIENTLSFVPSVSKLGPPSIPTMQQLLGLFEVLLMKRQCLTATNGLITVVSALNQLLTGWYTSPALMTEPILAQLAYVINLMIPSQSSAGSTPATALVNSILAMISKVAFNGAQLMVPGEYLLPLPGIAGSTYSGAASSPALVPTNAFATVSVSRRDTGLLPLPGAGIRYPGTCANSSVCVSGVLFTQDNFNYWSPAFGCTNFATCDVVGVWNSWGQDIFNQVSLSTLFTRVVSFSMWMANGTQITLDPLDGSIVATNLSAITIFLPVLAPADVLVNYNNYNPSTVTCRRWNEAQSRWTTDNVVTSAVTIYDTTVTVNCSTTVTGTFLATYVPAPLEGSKSSSSSSATTGIVVGIVIAVAVLVLIVVIIVLLQRKQRKSQELQVNSSSFELSGGGAGNGGDTLEDLPEYLQSFFSGGANPNAPEHPMLRLDHDTSESSYAEFDVDLRDKVYANPVFANIGTETVT